MKTVVAKGKSIEEAINNALTELNATREQVETKVLELPSNGIMGIFGVKSAKVEVTMKDDFIEKAKLFLEQIFEKFGIEATCRIELNQRNLNITLEGEDMGILIGRRGQTLDSIQYLTSLVVNKSSDEYIRVVIDTENYREKREDTLKDLAFKLAKKVEKNNSKVVLEPMNPYERRIIHSTLQNHEVVYTYSEGEEPFRKVVIDLKKTS
ncbi:RNA-binding cell elongation regulator Jag/EloR [Alkalibacter saccharofermentans]|uniref:RNA-binding protein KhpB n=1 Tax=Alkalibacter saccharofermentans DSM 14828 TaxID=1120975 RepID=A0A1M4T625_9FIRM|nr:RNA-binding cell elongation regulator Jag/EloR [Alkalibacter saccharofermentans]SHE39844.1 spoIIIJ-associated protein [Alkalibacter saccharofermentans DSM 14828]